MPFEKYSKAPASSRESTKLCQICGSLSNLNFRILAVPAVLTWDDEGVTCQRHICPQDQTWRDSSRWLTGSRGQCSRCEGLSRLSCFWCYSSSDSTAGVPTSEGSLLSLYGCLEQHLKSDRIALFRLDPFWDVPRVLELYQHRPQTVWAEIHGVISCKLCFFRIAHCAISC